MGQLQDEYFADGELDDVLQHYGRKGMKWGASVYGRKGGKKFESRNDGGETKGGRIAGRLAAGVVGRELGATAAMSAAVAVGAPATLPILAGIAATGAIAGGGSYEKVRTLQTKKARKNLEKAMRTKVKDLDSKSMKEFNKLAGRFESVKVKNQSGKWVRINT